MCNKKKKKRLQHWAGWYVLRRLNTPFAEMYCLRKNTIWSSNILFCTGFGAVYGEITQSLKKVRRLILFCKIIFSFVRQYCMDYFFLLGISTVAINHDAFSLHFRSTYPARSMLRTTRRRREEKIINNRPVLTFITRLTRVYRFSLLIFQTRNKI